MKLFTMRQMGPALLLLSAALAAPAAAQTVAPATGTSGTAPAAASTPRHGTGAAPSRAEITAPTVAVPTRVTVLCLTAGPQSAGLDAPAATPDTS